MLRFYKDGGGRGEMSDWFRFYSAALHDPKVQRLPGELFRERFFACLNGEKNEFSSFVTLNISGRPHHSEWKKLRTEVYARDDYTCRYCGVRGGRLECDHVFPVSRGGTNDLDNLATACWACNRSKRAKTLQEWQG